MKKNLKYKIILGATLLLFILFEILKPKPIDWNITLSPGDKIPFGTYVFRDLAPDLFQKEGLTITEESLYQILTNEDSTNLIIISKVFEPSAEDLDALYAAILGGKQCLLIAQDAHFSVRDTFDIHFIYNYYNQAQIQQRLDSVEIRLNNQYYDIPAAFISSSITIGLDSTKVLARTSESDVFLLEKKIGKGKLIVCSAPLLVTNYTLLSGQNASLLEGLITQLPDKKTTWASFYTSGRVEPQTRIRYLLSQPSLRWAYGIGMVVLVLFMLFRIKREQRQIPTIEPPKNTTVEFAETVGQLYLKNGTHKDIIGKNLQYLKEHLQSKYLLNVSFSLEEVEKVANKTGKDEKLIRTLFMMIHEVDNLTFVGRDQLMSFNKKLEDFYNNGSKP